MPPGDNERYTHALEEVAGTALIGGYETVSFASS
jgi:hypothetical protein